MKRVFDQDLLQRRVQNAQRRQTEPDFLWSRIAETLRDRLYDIKRDFPQVAEIGWYNGVIDDTLHQAKKIDTLQTLTPFMAENGILPFIPQTLDALVSCGVLHWSDDPQLMLKQYFFALKQDGVFVGSVMGGETLHELRTVLAETETELYGGLSPRVSPMINVQDLAGLMQQTGFALPVVDYDRITVTYKDLGSLLKDLRSTGRTNILQQRSKRPVSKKFWQRAEEIYRRDFADERGRLVVTLDVIYLLGWAPDPSQPQPKARGSATVHLGEALGRV
ncbi:MAG TPA: SAM-dependent methyltransferase [Alphaproteobacteria bacterium]